MDIMDKIKQWFFGSQSIEVTRNLFIVTATSKIITKFEKCGCLRTYTNCKIHEPTETIYENRLKEEADV